MDYGNVQNLTVARAIICTLVNRLEQSDLMLVEAGDTIKALVSVIESAIESPSGRRAIPVVKNGLSIGPPEIDALITGAPVWKDE